MYSAPYEQPSITSTHYPIVIITFTCDSQLFVITSFRSLIQLEEYTTWQRHQHLNLTTFVTRIPEIAGLHTRSYTGELAYASSKISRRSVSDSDLYTQGYPAEIK
jgi:hypothetical protein